MDCILELDWSGLRIVVNVLRMSKLGVLNLIGFFFISISYEGYA